MRTFLAVSLGLALATGVATAAPILSFGFTDLNASFTPTGVQQGDFLVEAGIRTDGDVTRVLPLTQTAQFTHDFTTSGADYSMSMDITNITPLTALASGTFEIRDINGDTITGNVAGSWVWSAPFAFFNGALSNVQFNSLGNGVFEGPGGGAFGMNFSAFGPAPYEGAIMTLQTGTWFTSGYQGVNALVQGAVVPEPAGVALVLGGLLLARRKR
mgnify:CR=1 FL=1